MVGWDGRDRGGCRAQTATRCACEAYAAGALSLPKDDLSAYVVLQPNLRAPPASAGTASRFAALSCDRNLFGRRARRRRSGSGDQTDEVRTIATSRGSRLVCNGGRVRREAVPVRGDRWSK